MGSFSYFSCMIKTITIPTKDLKDLKKGYDVLIDKYEKRGLDTLSSEDIEYYGAYLGKSEMIQYLLDKYKTNEKTVSRKD